MCKFMVIKVKDNRLICRDYLPSLVVLAGKVYKIIKN